MKNSSHAKIVHVDFIREAIPLFSLPDPNALAKLQSSPLWQASIWKKWPRAQDWPELLTVYEAAAFLRVHHHMIRRSLRVGRDGHARLPHQRAGRSYRISRVDLEKLGRVLGRGME